MLGDWVGGWRSGWGRGWRRALAGMLCALLLLLPMGEASAGGREAGSLDKPSGASWAEMQRRYKGAFVLSAPKPSRQVALTFDDVPDRRYTPLVLNVLKQQRVKATFFVVGSRALQAPELVRRIHAEGHAIGNHSFDHPNFSKLGIAGMRKQIRATEAALQSTVGFAPRLIRPPYGEIRLSQLDWAQKMGYTVVNWDVDSSDWRQLSAPLVFRNVTSAVRPGSIILLHAGGGTGQNLYGTVKALPKLIEWLRASGYEPVTLPELLQLPESKSD
ncbi:polysaccharide deacetylase family protein [Cohnella fermenti]|uniref:Polysaccharide deacetylase family protein n=1 Tax=Cohnella fermenti TaxID=2565925 RepID=A0A4S4BVB8_9BACL|nr:polysaccharide deacetylase family protein [Cohnella fermenti]THF76928.1 polysaccharide deacetylase family protein [Cohnella fermenti]